MNQRFKLFLQHLKLLVLEFLDGHSSTITTDQWEKQDIQT